MDRESVLKSLYTHSLHLCKADSVASWPIIERVGQRVIVRRALDEMGESNPFKEVIPVLSPNPLLTCLLSSGRRRCKWCRLHCVVHAAEKLIHGVRH